MMYFLVIRALKKEALLNTKKAPVQRILSADFPFQKVALDEVGLLTTSRNGNKYLIVIFDSFTRYAKAYPPPNIQS